MTTDLVWEIGDFLLPRLERAARAHPSDSEEGITASALAEAVATLVLTLEWTITGRTPGRVRTSTRIPRPPMPTEGERRLRAEMRMDRLRDDWNHLCVLAAHWRSAPGYRDSRWRTLEFRDAEHEHWYHQQLSYRHREGDVIRPPHQK